MSYILDALRRSESERYQEKLPELGGQAPLWLRRKERRSWWPALIVGALMLNAVVAGVVLWKRQSPASPGESTGSALDVAGPPGVPSAEPPLDRTSAAAPGIVVDAPPAAAPGLAVESDSNPAQDPVSHFVRRPLDEVEADSVLGDGMAINPATAHGSDDNDETWAAEPDTEWDQEGSGVPESAGDGRESPYAEEGPAASYGQVPTLVRPASPDPRPLAPRGATSRDSPSGGQSAADLGDIPLIDELSGAEKARIPALRFSSHIYSSSPEARSIMINQRNLREGQTFQGLRVVEITAEGVVLSLSGRVFQIPVLRDWSPDGR